MDVELQSRPSAKGTPELESYLDDFYATLSGFAVADWNSKPLRWRRAMRYMAKLHTGWLSQRQTTVLNRLKQLVERPSL